MKMFLFENPKTVIEDKEGSKIDTGRDLHRTVD